MNFRSREPLPAAFNDHSPDLTFIILGPNDSQIRYRTISNPHFSPVEDIGISIICYPADHATGIRTVIWFCQAKTPDQFTSPQLWEIFFPKFFRRVFINRKHDQRPLNRSHRPDSGITPFELLHNDTIGDLIHTPTPIFHGQTWPKSANLRQSLK